MDSFLQSTQKLEITGLIGGDEVSNETKNEDASIRQNQTPVQNMNIKSKEEEVFISKDTSSSLVTTCDTVDVSHRRQYSRAPTTDGTMIYVGNMTPEEIEGKTKELYQKIEGVWTCLHCGKTSPGPKCNIRFHVETHMDGLCYTCNICNKDFRSKNAFNLHKSRYHK